MALTLRTNRSSNLTATEVDNNFLELSGSIADIIDGTITVASASYAANGGGGGGGAGSIEYENAAGQVSPITRLKLSNETLQYGNSLGTGSLSVRLSAISDHIQGSDIIPTTDGIYDLGSDSKRWFDGYFTNNVSIGDINITDEGGSALFDADIITPALSADIANIGNINIIENTISVDVDASAEYAGNPTKLTIGTGLEVLGSTYGDKYVLVNGAGTPAENGAELFAAYDYAKAVLAATPPTGADDRFTVVITPGEYFVETPFTIDTNNIDVVSLTGGADVIITSPSPWDGVTIFEGEFGGGQVQKTPVHINGVQNVTVRGLNTGTKAILTRILSDTVLIENCIGGENSFTIAGWNDFIGQQEQIYTKGTFKNCTGGDSSFMLFSHRNGCTFINCTAGNQSFGYFASTEEGIYIDCTAGNLSFSSRHGESGQRATSIFGSYTRCKAGNKSFGHYAGNVYSQTFFVDCEGGQDCFGSNATTNAAYYLRCRAETIATNALGDGNVGGVWRDCVAVGGGGSWANVIGGIFENCYSNFDAFASVAGTGAYLINCSVGYGGFGTSFQNATAINCVIRKNSGGVQSEFVLPTNGGKQINCVHGNNVLINR